MLLADERRDHSRNYPASIYQAVSLEKNLSFVQTPRWPPARTLPEWHGMEARSWRNLAIAVAIGILIIPATAHAYLDPGTGSIIAQAVIGAFVAVGFFVRTRWSQLKSFVTRRHKGGRGSKKG
jgi:hypothetical protein